MAKSFWLGAGAGMLVAAAIVVALDGLLRSGVPDRRAEQREGDEARRELQEELAAVRRELLQATTEAEREHADAQALVDSLKVRLDQASGTIPSRADAGRAEAGAVGRIRGLSQLLARGDFLSAAIALSAAFEQGTLSKLELMQLAFQHPELVVAGVNQYDLPDAFRSALIDTLSSLEDPLLAVSGMNLDREPNQRFSSRIAAFLAQSVDRGAAPDARAVSAIEKLLSGNEMQGEKVNLYPVLAQLAALGDEDALALLQDADLGVFAPGLRALLDPPARDERGEELTGAILFSIQYNKGQWENRPRQFQNGDIVVSIGSGRVASAGDFFGLLEKHHGLGAFEYVEAGVFRPVPSYAGQFEYRALQLDPGDLQLMYGVYSVKRP